METKYLYQDWILDSSKIQGWHFADHKYVKFTEEHIFYGIDNRGKITSELPFEITDDLQLIVNGEVFGVIKILTTDKLEIAHSQSLSFSYKKLPQTSLDLQDSEQPIEQWITEHKWQSDLIQKGRTPKQFRLRKEQEGKLLQFQMLKEDGVIITSMNSEIISYKGHWSILYTYDLGGVQGEESLFIKTITKDQLVIELQEDSSQIILKRE